MADELAQAAMLAMQAIVQGMRNAGVLTDAALEAIEERTTTGIHYANVVESNFSEQPDPQEARIWRHAMWWARECIAPTIGAAPGEIIDHPKHLHEWPTLEQRRALVEED